MIQRTLLPLLAATVLLGSLAFNALAEPRSRVFLNGTATQVFFNDGDSFRILSGPKGGAKTRLFGYNTLESFGPVHRWGDWHAKELYFSAKMATLHARRGVWACKDGGKKDGYGRMLLDCQGLAISLISQGLAHAYSADDKPARKEYLEAQAKAQAEGKGMWAHGVPDFILTSIHSHNEDPSRAFAYNRLISTKDGHSEKWRHRDTYEECQSVCARSVAVRPEVMEASKRALLEHEEAPEAVKSYSDGQLELLLELWLEIGNVASFVTEDDEANALEIVLSSLTRNGILKAEGEALGSCMVHVDFNRRHGGDKAECLK